MNSLSQTVFRIITSRICNDKKENSDLFYFRSKSYYVSEKEVFLVLKLSSPNDLNISVRFSLTHNNLALFAQRHFFNLQLHKMKVFVNYELIKINNATFFLNQKLFEIVEIIYKKFRVLQ